MAIRCPYCESMAVGASPMAGEREEYFCFECREPFTLGPGGHADVRTAQGLP